MSRPLRIEYPGAWYHVMNRGRRREKIYYTEADYELFLSIIEECHRLFCLEVHAYSLMPNHYHLLVRTPEGNLSRNMRHLNAVYTQKMNRRHQLEGALFKGRYKAILIQQDQYLLELVRYIHLNPYKAKMESQVGKHKWTSHRAYMQRKYAPEWLECNFVLKQFSRYEKEARKLLHQHVQKEEDPTLIKRIDSVNWPAILGGEKFKSGIKGLFGGRDISKREMPQYREANQRLSVSETLMQVVNDCKLDQEIFDQPRKRDEKGWKRAFIYYCKNHLFASHNELSESLGNISSAMISKNYKKAGIEVMKRKGCYSSYKKIKQCCKVTS